MSNWIPQPGRHLNGQLVRRKYKEFSQLCRRIDELIANGLPVARETLEIHKVGAPGKTPW